MQYINNVVISGRLTSDVNVIQTNNTTIGVFDIASNYSIKKGDAWETNVNFFTCKKFKCDKIAQYLKKGQLVIIDGEMRYESWTNKEGKKCNKIVIYAANIIIANKDKIT